MNNTENRITSEAFFLGLALALISIAFKQKMIMYGIWAGSLISILNFKLLARDIEGRFSPRKTAVYRFFLKFPLRYGIMGAILWLAITKDILFFIGMAIGLFMVRIAIYLDALLADRQRRSGHGNRT